MSTLARPLKWPPIFPLDKGLVLWLPFDDRSGAKAYDRSGKGNHGTLYGPTWVAGRRGSALSFDGVDDYAGLGTPANLMALTFPMTITAWVNPVTLAQNGIIVSLDLTDANSDYAFGIYTIQNEILLGRSTYVKGLTGITTYLTAGKWQHWSIVFVDTTHIYFYLDGVLLPLSDVDTYYSCEFNNIGARSNGAEQQFKGVIGEVRIYNRALTAAEIKRRYESELMLVRH